MTVSQQPAWRADLVDRDTNPLARFYTRFRVADRTLLSGHSHQAWPDCSFEGLAQSWLDAADLVDEKWGRAEEQAQLVRQGYSRLLRDPGGDIALSSSTHDLLVRLLSAFELTRAGEILTTDGEFYSAARQFARLQEAGWSVRLVSAVPEETVGDRLADKLDASTLCVYVSSVFFQTARVAGGLPALASACRDQGTPLIVDAYHHLNVIPFSISDLNLQDAYVLGGGYKYCQLGEGNAFLRVPVDCELRPVITGWFSDFQSLTGDPLSRISYGPGGARFAGATYDPASHYRGARVFRFFEEQGLDPTLLRQMNQRQMALLTSGFDALDLDPQVIDRDRNIDLAQMGGFLPLHSPHAGSFRSELAKRGIFVDHRNTVLRLGPAPYVSGLQIRDAINAVGEIANSL